MWLTVVGSAVAAVTITREPTKDETTPPVVVADMYDPKADREARDEYVRFRERARLQAMDAAMRWQSPLVEACGTSGSATVRVSFADDGMVRAVKPVEGDEALAACIAKVYEGSWLPVFHVEPSLVWTFTFSGEPAAGPAPKAIDRDRGFNGVDFGAPAAAYEGMQVESSPDEVRYHVRGSDYGRQALFGAVTSSISYGFTDPDGLVIAYARFYGESAGFTLRQGLNGRYGASKVHPGTQAWYWQGKDVLIELYAAGEDRLVLAVMDIERAKRAGLLTSLPSEDTARKFDVPRYLRKDPPTP